MICEICGEAKITYYKLNGITMCLECADYKHDEIIDNYFDYELNFLIKNKPELIDYFMELQNAEC
jgi:hypothetical protein